MGSRIDIVIVRSDNKKLRRPLNFLNIISQVCALSCVLSGLGAQSLRLGFSFVSLLTSISDRPRLLLFDMKGTLVIVSITFISPCRNRCAQRYDRSFFGLLLTGSFWFLCENSFSSWHWPSVSTIFL